MDITIEKIVELLNSGNSEYRKQGILLAAKTNAVGLEDQLTRIAGSDPDQDLRILARKAIDRLKSTVSPNQAEDEKFANQHFEQLLQSEDPYARFAGLKKALNQNNSIARLCILSALEKEQVPQLKASMVMAVGRFASPDDVELISSFLRDSDSRVRANAVESLAVIGGEAANRHIIAMMADEDNRVKTNVVKALKGLGGPGLLQLLRSMAQDDRVWMRASAVFAFSRIKSPQSLVMLAQVASSDPEEQIRQKALAAINEEKKEGNPAAALILEKLTTQVAGQEKETTRQIETVLAPPGESNLVLQLQNEDPCRRYLALSELSGQFEKYAEAFIEAFQQEKDSFLLSMMLTVVKERKPPQTINRCIQLLKHDDDRVRANAVEAAAAVEVVSSADYIFPLLNDKNSRVAANAIIALGAIGRVDIFAEVKKLLNKGREAFRQSALYVISLQREQQYVGLLEKLLLDSSPKVRDKAYTILKSFVTDKVPGALRLYQDVEQRISLEKSRETFFENSLDQLFSSLVHAIKSSDNTQKEEFVFERTPEAEKQSLIQLARKALESLDHKYIDERTAQMLRKIEDELSSIKNLIEKSGQTHEARVEDAARQMSEIELLKIEQKSLKARRDAILVAFALDIFGARSSLDSKSQAFLRVELARVEGSLCTRVPAGSFSILPPDEASVSEIFDLTMRLYQKHVWFFSFETGRKFLRFLLMMMVAGFLFGIFKFMSVPVAGFFAILATPYCAYKALGIFVEWKILTVCMVEDFVHGREGSSSEWHSRVNDLYSHVFSNSLRKYFYLIAWSITALMIGGTVIASGESYPEIVFIAPLTKLIGLLMMIFVMASVYFKFLFIEPVSVLENKADAFGMAEKIFNQNKVKFSTLIIFSTFIMMLISGTSTQTLTFLVPVLPGKMTEILATFLAVISEVCLFPITFSSVVIYSLMFFRGQKNQV